MLPRLIPGMSLIQVMFCVTDEGEKEDKEQEKNDN